MHRNLIVPEDVFFFNTMQLSETKTISKSKMGDHVLKYIYTEKDSGVTVNELIKHEHSGQCYRLKNGCDRWMIKPVNTEITEELVFISIKSISETMLDYYVMLCSAHFKNYLVKS